MALHCVCVMTEPNGQGSGGQRPRGQRPGGQRPGGHCEDSGSQRRPGLKDIDLCDVVKRTEGENSRHNDHECHLKGEKRQNLINKLKMFLDDYDDRPVMKGKGQSKDQGKALGETGFGPLIKYPGYVDYDHPYFSDPYNKMPTLATTVGQRWRNPCSPVQMRNWDDCHPQVPGHGLAATGGQDGWGGALEAQDGRCHCAERSGETPRCPAAAGYM